MSNGLRLDTETSKVYAHQMICCRVTLRSIRAALSALLVVVLVSAPFESRFMMAAHAETTGFKTEVALAETSAGHVAASMNGHSHHDNGGAYLGPHEHGGQHALLDGTNTGGASPPTSHHDHSGGPDGACCGTFCHSACVEVAVLVTPLPPQIARFEFEIAAPLTPFAPGQLQRPPSRLLSI